MLTLMQIIRRMKFLEYEDAEIREWLIKIGDGRLEIGDLFQCIGYELSSTESVGRFLEVVASKAFESSFFVSMVAVKHDMDRPRFQS